MATCILSTPILVGAGVLLRAAACAQAAPGKAIAATTTTILIRFIMIDSFEPSRDSIVRRRDSDASYAGVGKAYCFPGVPVAPAADFTGYVWSYSLTTSSVTLMPFAA